MRRSVDLARDGTFRTRCGRTTKLRGRLEKGVACWWVPPRGPPRPPSAQGSSAAEGKRASSPRARPDERPGPLGGRRAPGLGGRQVACAVATRVPQAVGCRLPRTEGPPTSPRADFAICGLPRARCAWAERPFRSKSCSLGGIPDVSGRCSPCRPASPRTVSRAVTRSAERFAQWHGRFTRTAPRRALSRVKAGRTGRRFSSSLGFHVGRAARLPSRHR